MSKTLSTRKPKSKVSAVTVTILYENQEDLDQTLKSLYQSELTSDIFIIEDDPRSATKEEAALKADFEMNVERALLDEEFIDDEH